MKPRGQRADLSHVQLPLAAEYLGHNRSLKLTHVSRTTSGVQFLLPRERPGAVSYTHLTLPTSDLV